MNSKLLQRISAIFFLVLVVNQTVSAELRDVQGVVVDATTREKLDNVTINLTQNGNSLTTQIYNKSQPFTLLHDFNVNDEYRLNLSKEGYDKHSIDLTSALKSGEMPSLLTLSLDKENASFIFKGSVLNRESSLPVSNAKVSMLNTMTGELSHKLSNLEGEYSFQINSGYDYNFIVHSGKYLKRFARINYCGDRLIKNNKYCLSGFSDVSLDPNGGISGASLLVDKVEIGKKFKVDNIYYDYNKATLRADAIPNLKKLLYVLKDNPQITIELGSHADSRGSDAYNLTLSQKRAESAVNYITNNGIDIARVVAKGYGESVLTNECSNGVKCSDEKHTANRRTEFIIIGIDESKIQSE